MPDDRRRYRNEVERLLERIRVLVGDLQLSAVRGLKGPALSDKKKELKQTRRELAALVAASSH
ncbi:MAG: hypothetical protein JOY72_05460 [Actinobacteria bacterium]|nr:hypothetical protein [Actinomycetota bacterium]MBV8598985.1 hypothetical protein [Actinomycetota bacterium]